MLPPRVTQALDRPTLDGAHVSIRLHPDADLPSTTIRFGGLTLVAVGFAPFEFAAALKELGHKVALASVEHAVEVARLQHAKREQGVAS